MKETFQLSGKAPYIVLHQLDLIQLNINYSSLDMAENKPS